MVTEKFCCDPCLQGNSWSLERHSKIRRTIYVPSSRRVFYWHQLEAQIVNVTSMTVASCKYRKETAKEQKVGYSSYWINISPNFSQRTRVGQIWLVTVELSLMKHNTLRGKTWYLSPWPNSSSKARESDNLSQLFYRYKVIVFTTWPFIEKPLLLDSDCDITFFVAACIIHLCISVQACGITLGLKLPMTQLEHCEHRTW